MIIDSHRHLVKQSNGSFIKAKEAFIADMKHNNIERAIVIADNVSNSDTADTPTLLEIFNNDDNIQIIGAINPFGNLETQQAYYDKLLTREQIIGLKLFNGFDKLYPTDERCFASYQLAVKHNVPVIFHTGINIDDEESAKFNDPKYIVEIAKKFPKLKIIIAHFYWPKIEYCLETTRDIKNVYLDTTVLADKDAVSRISEEKIRSVLECAIELKPEGIIFGSDYPACQTRPAIDLIKSLNINTKTKDNIFYINANTIFNI